MLILVTPLILVQIVAVWVFYDRLWDAVARRVKGPRTECNFLEGVVPLPPGVDVDALLRKKGWLPRSGKGEGAREGSG